MDMLNLYFFMKSLFRYLNILPYIFASSNIIFILIINFPSFEHVNYIE